MVLQSVVLVGWLILALLGTSMSASRVTMGKYSNNTKLLTVAFGFIWCLILTLTVISVVSVIWVL